MPDLKQELKNSLFDLGIMEKQPCTSKENEEFKKMQKDNLSLPEGVHQYADIADTNGYYRIKRTDLTEDEIAQLLHFRQVKYLRSISHCMIYFVVLSVMSIFCFLFFLFNS